MFELIMAHEFYVAMGLIGVAVFTNSRRNKSPLLLVDIVHFKHIGRSFIVDKLKRFFSKKPLIVDSSIVSSFCLKICLSSF